MTPQELADRLRSEQRDVSKMAYAMALAFPVSKDEIESTAFRINAWIEQAAATLAGNPDIEVAD